LLNRSTEIATCTFIRYKLPERLIEPLRSHLERVKMLHERDLAEGFGEVYLPFALARKYPKAGRSWPWQYVFPGSRSVDPLDGVVRRHHVDEKVVQRAVSHAARKAGIAKPVSPHILGFDHDDLHARPEQGRARREEPARPVQSSARAARVKLAVSAWSW
jgi:hypothetical protein